LKLEIKALFKLSNFKSRPFGSSLLRLACGWKCFGMSGGVGGEAELKGRGEESRWTRLVVCDHKSKHSRQKRTFWRKSFLHSFSINHSIQESKACKRHNQNFLRPSARNNNTLLLLEAKINDNNNYRIYDWGNFPFIQTWEVPADERPINLFIGFGFALRHDAVEKVECLSLF